MGTQGGRIGTKFSRPGAIQFHKTPGRVREASEAGVFVGSEGQQVIKNN